MCLGGFVGLLFIALAVVHPVGATATTTSPFSGLVWGSGPQTITVVDRVRTDWNIGPAVAAWDRSPALTVRWAANCDYRVSHCVFIASGSYGPGTAWVGNTTSYPRTDGRTIAYVSIRLNDFQGFNSKYQAGTPRGRSEAFSHEFGHALGLAHRDGATVMRPVVTGAQPYASSSDLRELARLY